LKERPILFSAPMVRALLAGTKTQTRRVVKWRNLTPGLNLGFSGLRVEQYPKGFVLESATRDSTEWRCDPTPCPFGAANDRLWVRETFYAWGRWEKRFSATKGRDEWHFVDLSLECGKAYEYPASGGQPQPMGGRREGGVTPKWWKRPAIHMPRLASRLVLEITGVRVERLQGISEVDCLAEGLGNNVDRLRRWFRVLWEDINGAGSWDANPWVWVVEFKATP